jgi:hypothetical protein
MATEKTFKISFSESYLSVLSKIYVHLKVKNTKRPKKMHPKFAVDQLVNTSFSLPYKEIMPMA